MSPEVSDPLETLPPELQWKAVSDRRFVEDAAASPAATAAALRAIATLAWMTPEAAIVHGILRAPAIRHGLGALVAAVDAELVLGGRLLYQRHCGHLATTVGRRKVPLPDELVLVLVDPHLVALEVRRRRWRALADRFVDPTLLLAFCDRIVERDPALASVLLGRMLPQMPPGRGVLAGLPPATQDALEGALAAIPARPFWTVIGHAIGDASSFASDHPAIRLLGTYRPVPPREYSRHLRPAIARALAELGAPLTVALECIARDPHRMRRLARYGNFYPTDAAFHLFGMLVTVMRS